MSLRQCVMCTCVDVERTNTSSIYMILVCKVNNVFDAIGIFQSFIKFHVVCHIKA